MNNWLSDREIERHVLDLVDRARREYDLPDGCTGATGCAALGLSLRRASLPSGVDGLLADGRVVINEAIGWPPRTEFTIFHEIVHHLLDEDGELIEYFTRVLRHDGRAFDAAIERCCNIGAAEFLMPRARVRHMIGEVGFSVALAGRIAARSGTSLVAAALQLARWAPVDCYLVLGAHGPIPRALPPQAGLHLEYAFASPGVKYPLARFTPIPPDHLLATVWQDGQPATGRSYVPFRSGKRQPCHGDARRLGSRVVGLLALQRPITGAQLALLPNAG